MYSPVNVTVSINASLAPALRPARSSLDGQAFFNQNLPTGLPSALYMMREQTLRAASIVPLRAASCHDHSSRLPFIPRFRVTVGGLNFPASLLTAILSPLVSQYSDCSTSELIPESSWNTAISYPSITIAKR